MVQRTILSPSLSTKLSELPAQLGRQSGDRALHETLTELSALPADAVVRASREIARCARLGWWQPERLPLRVVPGGYARRLLSRLRNFRTRSQPFSRSWSEQELLDQNPDFAWLFLFHPSGYVRRAALDRISDPPNSPFWLAALAWRLNDWVEPVRLAATRCAERTLHLATPQVAADAALYLLDRRLVWGRWKDEPKILDRVFERADVLAALAVTLIRQPTGSLAKTLRNALRYPAIDRHLASLAADAVQPSVRAIAYQCLISGKANWVVGFEWAWIDKVYFARRRVPVLETREVRSDQSAADLIREASRDRSAAVRRVAADALIATRSRIPDAASLIAQLANDVNPSVRSRADYMLRHPVT